MTPHLLPTNTILEGKNTIGTPTSVSYPPGLVNHHEVLFPN